MSASFLAQGAYPAFPSFSPFGGHYLDRSPRGGHSFPATMGTVTKQPRTGNGKGNASDGQASRSVDDRRASSASAHEPLNHSALSSQAPGTGCESSHAPNPTEHATQSSPSTNLQTSPTPASMADSRYPTMTAQFSSPWYPDYSGPSSAPPYSRYSSAAPGPDAVDEYVTLAHQQLVSRPMEQSFSAQMPVGWPQAYAQPYPAHASYPSTPYPTQQFQQYPWPTQYPSPQSVSSPLALMTATTQGPLMGSMPSPFTPHSAISPPGISISNTSTAEESAMSTSPEMTSSVSSIGESVGIHSHRPGPSRTPRRRNSPKTEAANRSARVGPMTDGQKSKADMVRDLGACWRCRRYKKSCDGPGECSNCMRGNFRVWPSSLGCRRGCLEELVAHLVPVQAQDYLAPATRLALKQPNWRFGTINHAQRQMIEEQLPMANNWLRLSLKVQATGMYGPEFQSLLDIVTRYQAAQSRPNPLLESSISLLDSTCDIYMNFVACAWPLPPGDINAAIVTAQRAYAGVSKMFLTSALSGRRRDWLPSFLSMCMAFCAVMIMMDAAIAVPPQARTMVWGNIHDVSRDLRERLYPVTTDLLRASSNGTKPFALGCWSVNELVNPSDGSIELVRSPEGMRMLGGDKLAFDGMRSLQEWIRRNIRLMELGTKVIRSDPFTTPEVPSIAAVLKLFDL